MIRKKPSGIDRTPESRVDVCIVGAGIAGALVGAKLARRGYSVVFLEAGRRFDPEIRHEQMLKDIRPEHGPLDVWEMGEQRDAYVSSGERSYPLNRLRVKGVGGTTLHWLGITPRFHKKDFEMNSRFDLASDWPIDYDDLQPYYARAERELGVAGGEDNPFAPPRESDFPMHAFPPSYSDTLFDEACEALDIQLHSVPQARNIESYDGRSQCVGFSTCIPVCPSGAKYSGDVHVRKAEENGARIIDQAPVQRLETGEAGDTIEEAVYATPSGERYRQQARQFVLACGAVEIPRLLFLSKTDDYPDGLANSSGLVGKYLTEHPAVSVYGTLEQPTNQEPIGFHTSESHQFYDHNEPRPGSFKLEFKNVNPTSPVSVALQGREGMRGALWGDKLLERIREEHTENHTVGITALLEQLPEKTNSVTLNTEQMDNHGNPVPEISFKLGSHVLTTAKRALVVQRKILDELNATIDHETPPSNAVPVGHRMGTTRMGEDPTASVVNPHQRTHDIENLYVSSSSVFVTCGAMNPTLTIAALALRLADRLQTEL